MTSKTTLNTTKSKSTKSNKTKKRRKKRINTYCANKGEKKCKKMKITHKCRWVKDKNQARSYCRKQSNITAATPFKPKKSDLGICPCLNSSFVLESVITCLFFFDFLINSSTDNGFNAFFKTSSISVYPS